MRMARASCARLVLTNVAFVVGCSMADVNEDVDSWFNPPPSELRNAVFRQGLKLGEDRCRSILEEKRSYAVGLLTDVSVVKLTKAEAARLTGASQSIIEAGQPYLIRGLYRNLATGRFYVYVLGTTVVVHHGSLVSGRVEMKRTALLVLLDEQPKKVFVYCSTAR